MTKKIRVTILDDHQSIVDGYLYRLSSFKNIKVVATLEFGEELGPSLAQNPTDVLLLDFNIPSSPDRPGYIRDSDCIHDIHYYSSKAEQVKIMKESRK